jgi:hypothetical protein
MVNLAFLLLKLRQKSCVLRGEKPVNEAKNFRFFAPFPG